jgi:hypothetical protein
MERPKFLMPCVKLLGLETKNFSLIIVHTLYPSCLIFIHCNFMWHEYFHFCFLFDKHFFLPFTMICNFFFNHFQLTCKTKKQTLSKCMWWTMKDINSYFKHISLNLTICTYSWVLLKVWVMFEMRDKTKIQRILSLD